jgi:hypothetical protein
VLGKKENKKPSFTESLNKIFNFCMKNRAKMYAEEQKFEVLRKQMHKLSLAKEPGTAACKETEERSRNCHLAGQTL